MLQKKKEKYSCVLPNNENEKVVGITTTSENKCIVLSSGMYLYTFAV